MTVPILEAANLSVRRGKAAVLQEIDLRIEDGERVALLGDNGAGKSSLLLAIAGHLPCDGLLTFAGVPFGHLPAHRRARMGIGFCPEARRVFAAMTVAENLSVAAQGRQAAEIVREVFVLFPEIERRQNALAWQLSGGEQQMVALGRALMGRPRLLLLDEPFLGLAPEASDRLMRALQTIATSGVTLVVADQDQERSKTLCNRTIYMDRGHVID